jgi:hypothetical protein
MKITANQLRKIIAEEVAKLVSEDVGPTSGLGMRAALAVVEALKDRFDPNDPVMAANGKRAWDQQCDASRDDLAIALEGAMGDVLDKLYNGEYA